MAAASRSRRVRHAGEHDLILPGGVRVVDPVVQAAALEGVVDLTRAVGGEDHARRMLGPDGADLRDGHREVGEDLQEEGLELLVGAVDLVDEQDRRAAFVSLQCLQQGPLEEEARIEDVVGVRVGELALRLQQADLQHLARVVPLVDRRVDVQALVALEADEPGPQRRGQDLGQLRLAHAGLALQQQRPPEAQGQEDGRHERAVGHVVALPKRVLQGIDGVGRSVHDPNLAPPPHYDAKHASQPPTPEAARAAAPGAAAAASRATSWRVSCHAAAPSRGGRTRRWLEA